MIGKILDINITDAFVTFPDGTTQDISICRLPAGSKVGDTVNINPQTLNMSNDKLTNFF